MITEFLSSWPVFGPVYLTAIAGAVLLSVVGVLVVARDQVFLAAAVSQSSLLGVAAALATFAAAAARANAATCDPAWRPAA